MNLVSLVEMVCIYITVCVLKVVDTDSIHKKVQDNVNHVNTHVKLVPLKLIVTSVKPVYIS